MRLAPWERWLSAVTDARQTTTGPHGRLGDAKPRHSMSFRLVMAVLARYADHDTGTNARPSLRRLQTLTHLSHPTVRKALDTAEALGFITAAGLWTPPKGGDQITVWALGYPTPAGFIGWDAVSGDTARPDHRGDTAGPHHRNVSGDTAGPQHRDGGSVIRLGEVGDTATVQVGDTAGPHTTSSTSRPPGSEEDEEGASAPAPGGADTTRLEADVFTVLGQRWPDETPVVSKRSRRLLAELLTAGWADAQILAAINTIGKKPRNPALLLEAHLTNLLNDSEPRDFGPVSNMDTTTATATPPADPLAEANQTAVAKFCKWSGADREALSKALTGIAAQGYKVEASLAVDNYCQVYVTHPDLGDSWEVYWEAFQGVDLGEHVTHNEIRATFDGLPLVGNDRMLLMNLGPLGEVKQRPDGTFAVDVTATTPSVGVLRRFVDVTGPIALAAVERANETTEDTA